MEQGNTYTRARHDEFMKPPPRCTGKARLAGLEKTPSCEHRAIPSWRLVRSIQMQPTKTLPISVKGKKKDLRLMFRDLHALIQS